MLLLQLKNAGVLGLNAMDLIISIFYIAVIVSMLGLILLLVLRSQGIKIKTPAFFDPFQLQPMLMGAVALVFAVVGLFTSDDFVTWIPTPIFVAAAFAAMIYYSLKRN